ncbi:MAG: DUF4251 domain-containing protein [Chitinophagaceae bacterium]|jgi:hypothetical protein|nr:DUF4251 domain-containing protein [Chitinophagaceae bacterium]OQY95491.1 MAG: hypothetical protein B6D37_05720 [Sphingobacteriales bacterium UTBCD1]
MRVAGKIKRKLVTLALPVLIIYPSFLYSQNNTDINHLVHSGKYVFIAQYAIPMSGRTINLTPDNELIVSKDSLISYLPYFGRVYQAPMDPGESGTSFTSVKFNYKITKSKKDGWDIRMATKDQPDNYQLSLHISSAGYATLQVTNTFRQPISFNGYIREKNKS